MIALPFLVRRVVDGVTYSCIRLNVEVCFDDPEVTEVSNAIAEDITDSTGSIVFPAGTSLPLERTEEAEIIDAAAARQHTDLLLHSYHRPDSLLGIRGEDGKQSKFGSLPEHVPVRIAP